jgi:uncharacterized protein (TIGR00730 family)
LGSAPICNRSVSTLGRRSLTGQKPTSVELLNHLVRAKQQRLRDRNAERPGGLDIHRQLECGWTLDGQIGRLRALENLVDVARGALEAGGRTIGFNIGLPHEQRPNRYVSEGLCFEFHYFFMHKLWFAHLARGLVVFSGGFGTLDELTEILTLSQTGKLERRISIILYGSK